MLRNKIVENMITDLYLERKELSNDLLEENERINILQEMEFMFNNIDGLLRNKDNWKYLFSNLREILRCKDFCKIDYSELKGNERDFIVRLNSRLNMLFNDVIVNYVNSIEK